MGFVSDFVGFVKKTIPVVVRKVMTVLLFIFTLGMFFGYWLALSKPPYYLLIPIISMVVMYYKLDEGFLVFILLMLAAFYF